MSKEESFRLLVKRLGRNEALLVNDKELVDFLKKRTIRKNKGLKVVIGDAIYYAVEMAYGFYISKKKIEDLAKFRIISIDGKIVRLSYSDFKRRLGKLLKEQDKKKEVVRINEKYFDFILRFIDENKVLLYQNDLELFDGVKVKGFVFEDKGREAVILESEKLAYVFYFGSLVGRTLKTWRRQSKANVSLLRKLVEYNFKVVDFSSL